VTASDEDHEHHRYVGQRSSRQSWGVDRRM